GLMTAFLLRGASIVFCTQWNVFDVCAARLATEFARWVVINRKPPSFAMRQALKDLRAHSINMVADEWKELQAMFPLGTKERAHAAAQRAWLCLRSGHPDGL